MVGARAGVVGVGTSCGVVEVVATCAVVAAVVEEGRRAPGRSEEAIAAPTALAAAEMKVGMGAVPMG